ncbi:MAG TPA: polysaccharide biosynthesis C-terminal domain-containing protein, partial [Candidatus Glassbacteria bacterium]|nr:polysaccharide biosynthesis C-terminal domain-containing protein [Candidatus Glassbacteria bacterium]
NAAGSGAVFIFFVPVLLRYLRPVFSRKLFGIYFAFGFPIIFSSLGKNLLDLADRWILDRLLGAETVAYYSAGYQLAAVANLAVAAFTLAWKPFLVRAAAESDPGRTFSRIMTLSVAALLILFLAVSFFADDLVGVRLFGYHLIKESYWPGLAVIPPVMISYVFFGIYVNLTVGCDLTGHTHYYAWTTGAAAAFNVAANFLLIPWLGMMGSAWATLAAYVLQAAILYLLTRKLYPVSYDWGRLSLAFGLALGFYAIFKLVEYGSAALVSQPLRILFEGSLLAAWCVLMVLTRTVEASGLTRLFRRDSASES